MDDLDDIFGSREPAPAITDPVVVDTARRPLVPTEPPAPTPPRGVPDHAWVGADLDRALIDLRRINAELGIAPVRTPDPNRTREAVRAIEFAVAPAFGRLCRRAMLGTGRPCALDRGHQGACRP